MCLINVAHKRFIKQAGKKSKQALINFIGPGGRGRRAEKSKYPQVSILKIKVTTWWWNWQFALEHSQYLSKTNPVILPMLYTCQLLYMYNWVADTIYKNQKSLGRPIWKTILRSPRFRRYLCCWSSLYSYFFRVILWTMCWQHSAHYWNVIAQQQQKKVQ